MLMTLEQPEAGDLYSEALPVAAGEAEFNSIVVRDQVNKALRHSHHDFRAWNNSFVYDTGLNHPRLAGAAGYAAGFGAAVHLPAGVVLTSIEFMGDRETCRTSAS